MSPSPANVTLEQLLNLPLSTPTNNNVNVAILHGFLKIVISKLNIGQEPIDLHTFEGIERQELMRQLERVSADQSEDGPTRRRITDGPSLFQMHRPPSGDEKSQTDLCARLRDVETAAEDLRHQMHVMECNFRNLTDIENMNIFELYRKTESGQVVAADDGGEYSSECEDLCDPCEPCNARLCALLQNKDFLKKFMRKISTPMVEKMFEFEEKILILNKNFEDFLQYAKQEAIKKALVEECQFEIKNLKKIVAHYREEFLSTMEEIQDMMDAKLDKVHIPPLKRFIRERLRELAAELKALKDKKSCPKASGAILTGMTCVSCAQKVCQVVDTKHVPLLPPMEPVIPVRKAVRIARDLCGHRPPPSKCVRPCGGPHTVIQPSEKALRPGNLADEFGIDVFKKDGEVKYVKGINGSMYRAAVD